MSEHRDRLLAWEHIRWLKHNGAEAHHQCESCDRYERLYWGRDMDMTEAEMRLVDDLG